MTSTLCHFAGCSEPQASGVYCEAHACPGCEMQTRDSAGRGRVRFVRPEDLITDDPLPACLGSIAPGDECCLNCLVASTMVSLHPECLEAAL